MPKRAESILAQRGRGPAARVRVVYGKSGSPIACGGTSRSRERTGVAGKPLGDALIREIREGLPATTTITAAVPSAVPSAIASAVAAGASAAAASIATPIATVAAPSAAGSATSATIGPGVPSVAATTSATRIAACARARWRHSAEPRLRRPPLAATRGVGTGRRS